MGETAGRNTDMVGWTKKHFIGCWQISKRKGGIPSWKVNCCWCDIPGTTFHQGMVSLNNVFLRMRFFFYCDIGNNLAHFLIVFNWKLALWAKKDASTDGSEGFLGDKFWSVISKYIRGMSWNFLHDSWREDNDGACEVFKGYKNRNRGHHVDRREELRLIIKGPMFDIHIFYFSLWIYCMWKYIRFNMHSGM